jgi:hypothetical protein
MARQQKRRPASVFRVYADDEGQVFVQLISGGSVGEKVAVESPVTEEKFAAARKILLDKLKKKQEALSVSRASANREIEAALYPLRKGRWLKRLDYGSNYIMAGGLKIYAALAIIVLAYKAIQYSSAHFPEPVHFLILSIFMLFLVISIYWIGTEENRKKHQDLIKRLFGPDGMLILPLLLLVTAGAVLASITFRLFNRGYVQLQECSGRSVAEAGLLDFFMWHFLNIVPLLQLNSLLRWKEPYCFQQGRVGLMILAFQALVVIPSFNTIRFYWKNRKTPREFIYDPHWQPDAD